MRKKKRSIFALCLFVLCVLSGCGKNQEDIQQGQSVKQQDEQENEQKNEVHVQPTMKGEITISCFFEQEFLTTAVQQFMKLYPDVTVTINVYNETSGAGRVEDYQTYLNTKIMTGKAEDIIFNSFLPITKYSEMGVFEDLSRYISQTPELNEKNYFMNVLQSAKEESGEIYLIPYMAKFDVIGFSDELLSEQTNLEKDMKNASFSYRMANAKNLLQDTNKSNVFLINLKALTYANHLVEDSFLDFIDVKKKKVNINSDAYIDLLNEVKELSESNVFSTGSVDFYNTEYDFTAIEDYDVQAAFYDLDTEAGISYSIPMADREGNVAINANACLALNSASSNKDLAWEFVKYLLSEEVQTLPSFHGLSVNKQGFQASVERYYNFYTNGNKGTVNKAEYGALLESWMGLINDCDTIDSAIWTLIEEENDKFFQGKQSAEDAASILQRKMEQYFNE